MTLEPVNNIVLYIIMSLCPISYTLVMSQIQIQFLDERASPTAYSPDRTN